MSNFEKITVATENGEVHIISREKNVKHLQEKIDNAAHIEIDGLGKVVKYEHPMADKAEESYRAIVKPKEPKKVSFLAKLAAFFCPSRRVAR